MTDLFGLFVFLGCVLLLWALGSVGWFKRKRK